MKFVVQDQSYQPQLDIVMNFRDKKQIQNMKKAAIRLYEEAISNNNVEVQNIANYCLAESYFYLNDLDKCFALCWGLFEYYEDNVKDMVYVITCNLLGILYQEKTDMHNAITYFFKGYQQAEIEKSKEFEYRILNNIGSLFFDVECYEEALEYFMRVFHSIEENQVFGEIYEVTLVNILLSYVRKKDIESAIQWEKKYRQVFQDSTNIMGRLGFMTYEIIRDAHNQDLVSMKANLTTFLDFAKENWADLLTSTLILDTVEACLLLEAYDDAMKGFALIEEKVINEDFKIRLKMTDLYVQMYKKTNNKPMLLKCLKKYYEYHHKLGERDSEIEYRNLKNIVQLEEERYVKKMLMHRQAELSAKNEYDAFTGLLHKKSYVEYVNNYFSNKNEDQYAVFAIVDVDNFKVINDTLGHMYGDKVLRTLSKILRHNVRENDIIGRIGGDEFSFVLKDMNDTKIVRQKLQNILDEVNQVKLSEMEQGLSISVGGVTTNKVSEYTSLLKDADEALYKAKDKGKNTYVLIEKE